MGIELYWDDDEQVTILAVVPARWTWDEFHAVLEKVYAISEDEASAFSAAIVDVSQGVNLPDPIWSPATLGHARRVAGMAPQGTGPIVFVGVNAVIRSMFEVFRRLYPRATANVHTAKTQDAARRLIDDWLATERQELPA